MSRLNLVISTAIVALTLLPSSVLAQEKTLKQQVQGAWNLVSCDAKQPFCVNPTGSLSLNGNGRYTLVIAAKNRPTPALSVPGTHGENVAPEDFKAMARGVVANFGTWSVNEADKTLSTHSEEGLFPRPAGGGTGTKSTIVSVTADEMRTTGPLGNAVYRRFK
jgi:hypothetical protein